MTLARWPASADAASRVNFTARLLRRALESRISNTTATALAGCEDPATGAEGGGAGPGGGAGAPAVLNVHLRVSAPSRPPGWNVAVAI